MQRYLNLTIGKLMFIKVQILVVEKYKKMVVVQIRIARKIPCKQLLS